MKDYPNNQPLVLMYDSEIKSVKDLRDIELMPSDLTVLFPVDIGQSEIREYIMLKSSNVITWITPGTLSYQLEYTYYGDYAPSTCKMEEMTMPINSVYDLYNALYIPSKIKYLYTILNGENSFEHYQILDMVHFRISIQDSSIGKIEFCLDSEHNVNDEAQATFNDYIWKRVSQVFGLVNVEFGSNPSSRLCFTEDGTWHPMISVDLADSKEISRLLMTNTYAWIIISEDNEMCMNLLCNQANSFCNLTTYPITCNLTGEDEDDKDVASYRDAELSICLFCNVSMYAATDIITILTQAKFLSTMLCLITEVSNYEDIPSKCEIEMNLQLNKIAGFRMGLEDSNLPTLVWSYTYTPVTPKKNKIDPATSFLAKFFRFNERMRSL